MTIVLSSSGVFYFVVCTGGKRKNGETTTTTKTTAEVIDNAHRDRTGVVVVNRKAGPSARSIRSATAYFFPKFLIYAHDIIIIIIIIFLSTLVRFFSPLQHPSHRKRPFLKFICAYDHPKSLYTGMNQGWLPSAPLDHRDECRYWAHDAAMHIISGDSF